MAKQKKRNDGRIQKSFTFEGRRYYVYGYTAEEVNDKILEKKNLLKQHKKDHDNPTLNSFHDRWVENRRGHVKEATIRSQECHYKSCSSIRVNGRPLGEYRLTDIKPDDIRTVQRTLLNGESANSTQTVNDKIAFLSHIFHDAIRERYIEYNPCCVVRPLKRTEKRARDTIHRALSLTEQDVFFKTAKDSYYYDVFRMAVQTGMRVGEIGALYTSDIYDNAIHVERTITRTENGGYTIGTDTKTWHGQRTIPLNDQINEVIEHQKEINRMLDGDKIINLHDTIFKAPERGLLMATPADREIKRICKRTGIEHFTLHALRATFATRCIEQKMDVKTLQEILGHGDYGITMNLYGHVTDSTLHDEMSKIRIII